MKSSVKKAVHTGQQPIRVLKHNLTHRLIERNEYLIKKLQSENKLNNLIQYHVAELPLIERQTPRIDDKGTIILHETYLSYIWTISYSMFVMYEEGIAIPDLIRRGIPTHKAQNKVLVEKAEELFAYSKSLIRVYSEWDKENFPNPEYFDEETEEGWYILRTNDLFVEVMNFIMYHEIAHAELQHINMIKTNKLTNEQIKALELDADSKAVNLILENYRNINVTRLAIVIGLASMLFFNNSVDGGRKHPSVDMRLQNALGIIKPEYDSPVWALLVLFLKQWDTQFSLSIPHKTSYDTYEDMYYELIGQVK